MNEKEAREILSSIDPERGVDTIPAWFEWHKSEGYMEGLEDGREKGRREILDKAKGLEEALEKIANCSWNLGKFNPAVQFDEFAKQALSEWRKVK